MRLVQFNGQIKKIGDNLYIPDAFPMSDEFAFPQITDECKAKAYADSVDGTSYQFFIDESALPDDVKEQIKDNATIDVGDVLNVTVPEWLIDHAEYFIDLCITPKEKVIISLRIGCELYAVPDFENHTPANEDEEIIIAALKQNKAENREWENITKAFAAYSAIDCSVIQSEFSSVLNLMNGIKE